MAAANLTVSLRCNVRYSLFKRPDGTDWIRLTMWVHGSTTKTHSTFPATPHVLRRLGILTDEE
jgi:hypothetical protein